MNCIESPFPTDFIRVKGISAVRPLVLTFSTEEEAVEFIQCLSRSKKMGKHSSLIVRLNYNIEDEKKHQTAWAEACDTNDKAGRREYVVRHLKVRQL